MIIQSIDIAPRFLLFIWKRKGHEYLNIKQPFTVRKNIYLSLNDIFRKGGKFKFKKRLFINPFSGFPGEYFLVFNGSQKR